MASLQSNSIFVKHHLTGMASLAILASLGLLHIDALDTWVWYDVACMANHCPGDAPGAASLL